LSFEINFYRVLKINISFRQIEQSHNFMIRYKVEVTRPDQLQITIYERSLKNDGLEDESHVPYPILPSSYPNHDDGTSFNIDSQVYEFR
jgi:hypothetical protein